MSVNYHCRFLARSALFAGTFLGLLSLCVPAAYAGEDLNAPVMDSAHELGGAPSKPGISDTISIDFTTFPDGTPIPQNLDGEYGTPGTTLVNRLTNEFESLGVVFVSPPGLVTILVGPPSCEFCGIPPVGGLLVGGDSAGNLRMNFLVPVSSVTIDIIGAGLDIAASLKAFNTQGALLGTVTHTYTGNTGVLSPFTFTAPPREAIASIVYNGTLNSSASASIGRLTFVTEGTKDCLSSDRQVYDARADFRPGWIANKNPNGCWTYGWTKGIQGNLMRFPKARLYPINNGLEQMWYDPANNAGATPSVARNSGGDYDDSNVTFLAGALILHPGGKDGRAYAHVIWTAPRHGDYLVRSVFFSQQYSIDVDVNILVNQKRIFNDTLTKDGAQRGFVREVRLAKGDTIDFAVGPNGNYFLHPANTGLDAQIIRLTPKQQDRDGDSKPE